MQIDVVRIELTRSHTIEIPEHSGYVFGVDTAAPIFCHEIGRANVEHAALLCMDSVGKIINFSTLALGDVANVKVPASQVVKTALLSNASSIIIAHNHPSGILEVTSYDISLTRRIGVLSMEFGIRLLDSLVVNGKDAVSIREH